MQVALGRAGAPTASAAKPPPASGPGSKVPTPRRSRTAVINWAPSLMSLLRWPHRRRAPPSGSRLGSGDRRGLGGDHRGRAAAAGGGAGSLPALQMTGLLRDFSGMSWATDTVEP